MRALVSGMTLLALVAPASAQLSTNAPGSAATSTTQPPAVPSAASLQGAPVKRLLMDGFEVKAGFADSTGGAYMVLQKATSAYLCHSNPNPICEKLN